ncbi:MAG: tetratricopeptide repeat protein [Bacteroidota bacterium]
MMQKEDLMEYMAHPEKLDHDSLSDLDDILREWPYFQTAELLKLKNLHNLQHPDYENQLTRTAIFCADRKRLFYLINDTRFGHFINRTSANKLAEPTQQVDRTQKLIDSFLDTYTDSAESSASSLPDPEASLATTDYIAYLSAVENRHWDTEEASKPLQHEHMIDSFIEKVASNDIFTSFPQNEEETTAEKTGNQIDEGIEDEFLTETLAKIYIKQKKYEPALAIIQRLSLNFPKKSAYFADQIRFLELLIFNEKNKKQS